MMMVDDHAQHALSCYGNKDIQTPGMDRIAIEGMRFEHALTPNAFCTPSRAAVLTGKYSHKNVDDNVGRVLEYLETSGLDKNTLVLYTSDQGFSLGEHGFYNKQCGYRGRVLKHNKWA